MNSIKQNDITPDMTVLDIIGKYRETEAVFKRYDAAAGECICCNALFETVKEISEKYEIDLQEILRDLHSAISGPG
ncbi:MAG: hypothetical protein COX19_07465 [Desulfobacterales bacterium CG23_combo_of_CG06-09_8_20_14_all_51_8]|nr:MAG: hypothetical protein COX19_07465 [Desulfobacterales bacterium CG23_combo_of_CG06-09_8_20_14_all_51_8]